LKGYLDATSGILGGGAMPPWAPLKSAPAHTSHVVTTTALIGNHADASRWHLITPRSHYKLS